MADPRPTVLPEWPTATIAVLSTLDHAPHAIPVSAPVRAGDRRILLSLHRDRGSLARLRERPLVALTILAEGDVALTARGRARIVRDPMAGAPDYVAVAIEVDDIDDHRQPEFTVEAGVDRRWGDEDARRALRGRVQALAALTAEDPPPGPDRSEPVMAFRDLLATAWITHAIHAAASLDLAEAAADGPRTATDLAAAVGADPVGVDRLLRALVTVGLFDQAGGGAYRLTPMGGLLRAGAQDSLRERVLLQSGAGSRRNWGAFAECVRTGRTAASILDGVDDPFAFFLDHPEAGARFDAAMAEGTTQLAGAIAAAYDYSGIASIVDVGGGYGTLLPAVLRARPAMTGVVFDRPHCRAGAERLIEDAGLADRYAFVGGDFFADPLPPGADAYVLKSVLHDWDDDRAVAVLRRCRAAMPDSARLLVVEVVVPDRLDRSATHRRMVHADLHMLVATGGRERTEAQYRALFADAGLRLTRIAPTDTPAGLSVIEARPTPGSG